MDESESDSFIRVLGSKAKVLVGTIETDSDFGKTFS